MSLLEQEVVSVQPLSGQIALVTGGSRGIGAEIAKELAAKGATVIINYAANQERAQQVLEEISAYNPNVYAAKGDVSNPEDVARFFDEILEDFGKIDILVNNAGITRDSRFVNMTDEQWHEVIGTNMNSLFYLTKIALPKMIEQNYGRIINISSIIGQSGGFGQVNYSAAKAGMIGFTKSLALEVARYNITVNCVCPGYTFTDMVAAVPEKVQEKIISKIPLGRFGQANEVAKAVSFLAVDGDYITGQCININGGMYM
ncbi:3-oxoacyl-[acyl-carrier-protein] reductase [Effusibacillus lacus]|uniref:3-oxoacyl-[acyl-carrier-protein] reductase n=1 Tax=Effusibacillus lacus TaxID=1348429 RepID=A0A292YNI9_9BACL|nr:3-oxoacyl-[acyl-carrier-protein] reductase [Effusibacillus lacus]TCS71113.1 3-oxoacyl-[acyl-carrier-protein] reductase [Effusibacillus lacus]GAX90756.1 beta-ketoacyl-ACP reductase [Effusibacillus lacus]